MENDFDGKDIIQRVDAVRRKLKMTQAVFADSIGMTQGGYATMLIRSQPYQRKGKRLKTLTLAIQAAHGIPHQWLMTGEDDFIEKFEADVKRELVKWMGGEKLVVASQKIAELARKLHYNRELMPDFPKLRNAPFESTPALDAMREELAESEFEGLKDRDLRQILWDGCPGWNNFSDEEIVTWHYELFGQKEEIIVTP